MSNDRISALKTLLLALIDQGSELHLERAIQFYLWMLSRWHGQPAMKFFFSAVSGDVKHQCLRASKVHAELQSPTCTGHLAIFHLTPKHSSPTSANKIFALRQEE